MTYDVIIVGAGPAGIFCALELLEENSGLNILMLDKGNRIDKRSCPNTDAARGCKKCKPCKILAGWGGAGAFSDGKLTISTQVGGWLDEILGEDVLTKLVDYVDNKYLSFGAPNKLYGDDDKIEYWSSKAQLVGLELIPQKVRHMGREGCISVMQSMYDYLADKIEIRFKTEVKDVLVLNDCVTGVRLSNGETIEAQYVVLAPGRIGNGWVNNQAKKLGLEYINNYVDIGVRVEVPEPIMKDIAADLYEPKLVYYSKQFDDKIRLFCFNPGGVVTTEFYDDILTVNGQAFANSKTNTTNFALLVSTKFTEPFTEPLAYGQHVARLANMLGGGPLIQRLSDLKKGKRSTLARLARAPIKPSLASASPGDLSFVLPHRHLSSIIEMLEALNRLCPGLTDNAFLYGIEVKFYSARLCLSNTLETNVNNLYAAGDGAGITRGLIQASVSGVVIARNIKKKCNMV